MKLARTTLQQVAEAFGAKVEDVAGLGRSAFWVDNTDSLNAFTGKDKLLIVNTPSGPNPRTRRLPSRASRERSGSTEQRSNLCTGNPGLRGASFPFFHDFAVCSPNPSSAAPSG